MFAKLELTKSADASYISDCYRYFHIQMHRQWSYSVKTSVLIYSDIFDKILNIVKKCKKELKMC